MSRADRVVLAVDLGTGGPKVGFVSLDGTVLWSDLVEVSTEYGRAGPPSRMPVGGGRSSATRPGAG